MHDWLEILSASPLFAGIESIALDKMLNCLQPRVARYKGREIIATAGSPFHGVGIVAEGEVALSKETYAGNRIIIDVLGPRGIFGEVVAFSDDKSWPVTVIARDDCLLLFLPAAKILGNCSNICPAHSALILNMLNILSNKISLLNQKLEHLSAKSIRGRLSSYLLSESRRRGHLEFTLSLKRHELADYLGIPRPSLSREMGRMHEDGLIEYSGSWLKINNAVRLEQATG